MGNGTIVDIVITAIGIGGGYFIGKRKNTAEIRKLDASATIDEISATEKAVSIWRGLAEELRGEVAQLRLLVNELKEEIDELRAQNEALSEEMKIYKMQTHD